MSDCIKNRYVFLALICILDDHQKNMILWQVKKNLKRM
jgi:hypothetical protein